MCVDPSWLTIALCLMKARSTSHSTIEPHLNESKGGYFKIVQTEIQMCAFAWKYLTYLKRNLYQWQCIEFSNSKMISIFIVDNRLRNLNLCHLQIFEFDSANNIRRAPIIKMTQLTFNGVKGKPILIGPCFEILSTQLQQLCCLQNEPQLLFMFNFLFPNFRQQHS